MVTLIPPPPVLYKSGAVHISKEIRLTGKIRNSRDAVVDGTRQWGPFHVGGSLRQR